MAGLSLAIIGAGAIGRLHAAVIARNPDCRLAAMVEPADAGRDVAAQFGAAWYRDVDALLGAGPVEGAIIATPNQMHVPLALAFVARGIPVLVEKPVADTVDQAQALAEAAARTGVPVLVGHQRRHNPILRKARAMIAEGALGRLTAGSILSGFLKPPPYFDLAWRREPGGGPVLINLIHEVDLVRFVCGEIVSVQAVTSNRRRGFAVEDTAAVILTLANDALITVTLSDTVAAPWSWDLSSGENPAYPPLPEPVNSHYLMGTEGGLTLPGLQHWRYAGAAGWHEPLTAGDASVPKSDPYQAQLAHFLNVICGREMPVIDAADGARTLAATLAVHEAARMGCGVGLPRQAAMQPVR